MGQGIKYRPSTWRSIQGLAATKRDVIERSNKQERDPNNPWNFDRWSFDPTQITVYRSRPLRQAPKPGDLFSGEDEGQQLSFHSSFSAPSILQLATIALLAFSGGLLVFLISQIL